MQKLIAIMFLAVAVGAGNRAAADVSADAKYCKLEQVYVDGKGYEKDDAFEARLRSKCQVGDIIESGARDLHLARICDFSKQVVITGSLGYGDHFICYLAPKREDY
jgi:hypothetical protein